METRSLALFLFLIPGFLFAENALPTGLIAAEVVEVKENRRLVLALAEPHSREIEVRTGPGDHANATVGRRLRGELIQLGGEPFLQNIWPDDPRALGTIRNIGRQLNRETLERGRRAFRDIHETWPRFALFDQHGDLFLSESLRGQYVMINFIFSRCLDPVMCPAATERMRLTQELARERGIDNLHFVSITLDPDYDTPGILRAYADGRAIDLANFSFLTGPADIIEDLKTQMGILSRPHPTEIFQHTMSTTLVDPVGRIFFRIPGSSWTPEAFIRQLERHRDTPAAQ